MRFTLFHTAAVTSFCQSRFIYTNTTICRVPRLVAISRALWNSVRCAILVLLARCRLIIPAGSITNYDLHGRCYSSRFQPWVVCLLKFCWVSNCRSLDISAVNRGSFLCRVFGDAGVAQCCERRSNGSFIGQLFWIYAELFNVLYQATKQIIESSMYRTMKQWSLDSS